jgi:MazG family protein
MPSIDKLIATMAALRDPERGCPWDREQTFATILPYTIEEAYEVADAIEEGDMDAFKEELGDLLFQVVFHARMAQEQGLFDFEAVAEDIATKMIRRHPHVFGDATIADSNAQLEAWEATKASERSEKAAGRASVLDGIARALPASTRAFKLQKRAARVGFDWTSPHDVLAKVEEEIGEVVHEMENGNDPDRIEDEIGDVLFACVNLARKLNIDPDRALRRANAKFEYRFRHIEHALAAAGRSPAQASLAEMEALWAAAKANEKHGRGE